MEGFGIAESLPVVNYRFRDNSVKKLFRPRAFLS